MIPAILVLHGGASGPAESGRLLTFEDRVEAQRAIERVYHSHLVGEVRPFHEAVPDELLERKVRTNLRQSVALDKVWRTPVTAEALRREMARIVSETRHPERLREILDALHRDPVLILECLARPTLVDRLARSFYAGDRRLHAGSRAEIEDIRDRLRRREIDVHATHPRRSAVALQRASPVAASGRGVLRSDHSSTVRGASPVVLSDEAYARAVEDLHDDERGVGPVVEGGDRFVVQAVLAEGPDGTTVARYVVPKVPWDAWWSRVEAGLGPDSVSQVVWDPQLLPGRADRPGSLLSSLEGAASPALAASSCPPDDTWDKGVFDDQPAGRHGHTTVWTGSPLIIWGGDGGRSYTGNDAVPLNTGATYDPVLDTWGRTSTEGAPSPRFDHTAVLYCPDGTSPAEKIFFALPSPCRGEAPAGLRAKPAVRTGSRMLVWGGTDDTPLGDGAAYDPIADAWEPASGVGAPSPRAGHTAVWADGVMIVWGGRDGQTQDETNSGALYDPVQDAWSPVSSLDAPDPRTMHQAVWTGEEMIVWGGTGSAYAGLPGGRYDPVADAWSPISSMGAPFSGVPQTAVWTGEEMIVWGSIFGTPGAGVELGRYDPASDVWLPVSPVGAPEPRVDHTAVWTGAEMLIWGGLGATGLLATGAAYDPRADSWRPISDDGAPTARRGHGAAWTGRLMVLWGGFDGTVLTLHGGRYDPASDAWTSTSTVGPPSPTEHTSVWSGTEMLVWGGRQAFASTNRGGRYDPVLDAWRPMTSAGAPAPRERHVAVWTGSLMLAWGGGCSPEPCASTQVGGRYDPIRDEWTPISTEGQPWPSSQGTAVWSGREMIVWASGADTFGFGGRYDPDVDAWSGISRDGAPHIGPGYSAVWTGREMIVWGGESEYQVDTNAGGRYDPDSDVWTPTSTVGAPAPRSFHSAIWSGDEMIVWGGHAHSYPAYPLTEPMNSGARYDPVADAWAPTSMDGVPLARAEHTAVWTGREMIVWGGEGFFFHPPPGSTGGRYDPGSDAWRPTSTLNAPGQRWAHRAVWTGTHMLVFGGGEADDAGGRYAAGADEDGDGAIDVCDSCSGTYNPTQQDTDGDGEGDDCDLTVTHPRDGEVTCANAPPLVQWTPETYGEFRLYVSWDARFRQKKTLSSGKRPLTQRWYRIPEAKWRRLCARANPNIYVKVLGIGRTAKTSEFSGVAVLKVR